MPLRDLGSGSGLDRRFRCEASAILPVVESSTPWASRGTDVHAFLERANTRRQECESVEGARLMALMDMEEQGVPRETITLCESIDLSRIPIATAAAEVAMAYDPATGRARELGRSLGRRYRESGLRAGEEIPCTLDLAALVGADAVYVGDYKSGWSSALTTPPAERNPQLLLGALAMCRAHGRSRAIVEIVRIFDDGGVWKDQATIDAFALAEFEGQIAEMVERDRANAGRRDELGEIPHASVGSWCTYCPSYCYCPAVTGLVRQFGAAPEGVAQEFVALLTPETAAEARRRYTVAKKMMDRIEAAIVAYARETPIDMGDGVVYGPRPWKTDTIDGPVAERALTAEFDAEFAKAATAVECTKAGISKAVRKWLSEHPAEDKRGALGAMEKRALAAIDRAGGLTTETEKRVMEHRPKGAVKAAA